MVSRYRQQALTIAGDLLKRWSRCFCPAGKLPASAAESTPALRPYIAEYRTTARALTSILPASWKRIAAATTFSPMGQDPGGGISRNQRIPGRG